METVALLSCLLPFCLHVGDSQLTQAIAFLGLLAFSVSFLSHFLPLGSQCWLWPFSSLFQDSTNHSPNCQCSQSLPTTIAQILALNVYSPLFSVQTQRNHFLDYGHIQTIAIFCHNFLSKFLALLAYDKSVQDSRLLPQSDKHFFIHQQLPYNNNFHFKRLLHFQDTSLSD